MAVSGILVDTGPLVALLSERDQYHAVCVATAKELHGPFYTSWPVITEAAYLLRDRKEAVAKLLSLVRSQALRILPLLAEDVTGLSDILLKYADQEFDLADASLMYLAEREGMAVAFTVDRRHFSVYRTSQGKTLSLFPASL